MTKAYSYRRFSSPEQGKGRSKDRQLEACQKYCLDHGLELATGKDYLFLDEGKSAFKGEQLDEVNGQLARFLKLVDEGTITAGSYLIVESLDRLGRDRVKDALMRFMTLLSKGINVVTLADNRVYREDYTEMDLMLSILVMSRAHEESVTKAMRVGDAFRKKQQNAREHHLPMGNAIPMWLAFDGKGYTAIPFAEQVVKRIFDLCIAGYGKAATAKLLNGEAVPSFKAAKAHAAVGRPVRTVDARGVESFKIPFEAYKDTAWGISSVDKILNNRAVLGEYQPFTTQGGAQKRRPIGEPIKDYYPRLISDSVFYQAQAAKDGRRRSKITNQSKNFNVWAGLAKCALCRSAMHLVNKGKPPKGNTYMHCSSARKGLCGGKAVRLDHSEVVFRELLARLDSVALVEDNALKISEDLSEVTGRLMEKQALRVRYREALRTRFTELLNDEIYECEQEIAALKGQQQQLQRALASEKITSYEDFRESVDLVSYEGRSRANSLCKRLEVQVYIGRGYFVTERGEGAFAFAYKEGRVGCISLDEAGPYNGDGEVLAEQLLTMMSNEYSFVEAF
jgi:DNA invertase Pin-like site-specific DNA recombinase